MCSESYRCLIGVSSFSRLQGAYSLVAAVLPLTLVVEIAVGVGVGVRTLASSAGSAVAAREERIIAAEAVAWSAYSVPGCVTQFTFTLSFTLYKRSMKGIISHFTKKWTSGSTLEWAPPALMRADLRISAQGLEIGSGVSIYTTAIGIPYIVSG